MFVPFLEYILTSIYSRGGIFYGENKLHSKGLRIFIYINTSNSINIKLSPYIY